MLRFKVYIYYFIKMYFVVSQFMHAFVPTKIPVYNLGVLFHIVPKHIPISERWECRDFKVKT